MPRDNFILRRRHLTCDETRRVARASKADLPHSPSLLPLCPRFPAPPPPPTPLPSPLPSPGGLLLPSPFPLSFSQPSHFSPLTLPSPLPPSPVSPLRSHAHFSLASRFVTLRLSAPSPFFPAHLSPHSPPLSPHIPSPLSPRRHPPHSPPFSPKVTTRKMSSQYLEEGLASRPHEERAWRGTRTWKKA